MTLYTVTMVGYIWYPTSSPCSTSRTYSADSDVEAIRTAGAYFGDFSEVLGYRLTASDTCSHGYHGSRMVRDWSKDIESMYLDTIAQDYGSGDES